MGAGQNALDENCWTLLVKVHFSKKYILNAHNDFFVNHLTNIQDKDFLLSDLLKSFFSLYCITIILLICCLKSKNKNRFLFFLEDGQIIVLPI